jgi:hypothetical protein
MGCSEVNTFDYPRILRYYDKVLDAAVRSHGEDWRSEMYRGRVGRIRELSTLESLSAEAAIFMVAREAVSEAFGRK